MRFPRDAVVIGAGVVGVSTAYALASRGICVTIVDRNEEAARSTSYANGGQLSYLYTDALANPRIISQLPKLALGMDPSFRIKLRLDPEFTTWLARFLANCTNSQFASNTRATLSLALKSRQSMQKLLEQHDLKFNYAIRGKLHVYQTDKQLSAAHHSCGIKSLPSSEQHFLSAEEALELEPALATSTDKVAGAMYSPDEAVGDPHLFSNALLHTSVHEYDVTARLNTEVRSILFSGDQAIVTLSDQKQLKTDLVVVCTGGNSDLLRRSGVNAPICPMKGYSFTAPLGAAAPHISVTNTSRRVVFTRLGNEIRIAGLADLGWANTDIQKDRMASLIDVAKEAMPLVADFENISNHWTGIRAVTPNSQPYIGRPRPSLAYNVGHGMLGWTMAMGAGEKIAELVMNNQITAT